MLMDADLSVLATSVMIAACKTDRGRCFLVNTRPGNTNDYILDSVQIASLFNSLAQVRKTTIEDGAR